MKRFLLYTLALFLLVAGLFLPVRAETEKGRITITADKENPDRGESFTVTLELNRNPGVASMRLSLQYDKAYLEVENVVDGGALSGFSVSDYSAGQTPVFRWVSEKNQTGTGNLAKITFRVQDDAAYGESLVTAAFSAGLFDITDEAGRAVEFRSEPYRFNLVCRHSSTEDTVEQEATLQEAGRLKETCLACGEAWEKEFFYRLEGEDRNLSAAVPPTAFPEAKELSLTLDYFYGGEEYDVAKSYFPDTLVRAFSVSFRDGVLPASPEDEVMLTLKTEFALPDAFRLYCLTDEGIQRVDALFGGEELIFPYGEGLFLLVNRTEETAPPQTEASGEEIPAVTDGGQEETEEEDSLWIVLAVAFIAVMFGVFALYLLKQKKPF